MLNRYYNFAHPDSTKYLIWYVAEVGTAVYVVNVPACWPLLRKAFPRVFGYSGNSGNAASGHSSFRLRSDIRKSSQVLAMTSSESEENLASELAHVQHGRDDKTAVYNPGGNNYWAGARGTTPSDESTEGITKTVQVDVS